MFGTPEEVDFWISIIMVDQIPMPTLNDAIERMEKDGGHLKGKGNGGVYWESDDIYTDVRRLENGE